MDPSPDGYPLDEAHSTLAVGALLPPPTGQPQPKVATAAGPSDTLEAALLRTHAESLNDFEGLRITTGNRIYAFKAAAAEAGMEEEVINAHPDVRRMEATQAGLQLLEDGVIGDLERTMRQHPLGPWVKRTTGVGLKQGARLIACYGVEGPGWNKVAGRPRTLSELWAYSGYHVIDGLAPARRKGQRANWNAQARTRAYLCADSVMKGLRKPCVVDEETRSATHVEGCKCYPLRIVYDAMRAKHATALHAFACAQCGPAGKPALPGSPLGLKHQQARALRIVSKELLRSLWLEATEGAR